MESKLWDESPYVILPWAGFMWELHTVSINFNNLNNIWMCCTHHVQTYLEEKGRSVTVCSEMLLAPPVPPSAPQDYGTHEPGCCQLCSAPVTPSSKPSQI